MIELAKQAVDFVLHIDQHLQVVIADYGLWTYALLFFIIFAETGFVVTPFLPGDSLLFAAGALCAGTVLNVHLLAVLLTVAAVLGNTINYALGAIIGPKVFRGKIRGFCEGNTSIAPMLFEKYGGRSVILSRFMPIVRTFVPFVAGAGSMSYRRFFVFNLIGGTSWIYLLTYLGYLFGRTEIVKKNFSLVVVAIIVISLLPMAFEVIRGWRESRRAAN